MKHNNVRVRRIERIQNNAIRRCGLSIGVGETMDQGVLRWFGDMEGI